jgi:hypothetical protein
MPIANEQTIVLAPLPFGLTPERVPAVVIEFSVTSTKAGSGFDEIIIRGTGDVVLRTAAMDADEPAQLTGRVEPAVVTRLLQLLHSEGIEGWDDEYPGERRDFVTKLMTIRLGEDDLKVVAMRREEFPEFSRAFGAIKMVASQARPEAVGGRFLQRI